MRVRRRIVARNLVPNPSFQREGLIALRLACGHEVEVWGNEAHGAITWPCPRCTAAKEREERRPRMF